jgi:hypothetical protein
VIQFRPVALEIVQEAGFKGEFIEYSDLRFEETEHALRVTRKSEVYANEAEALEVATKNFNRKNERLTKSTLLQIRVWQLCA